MATIYRRQAVREMSAPRYSSSSSSSARNSDYVEMFKANVEIESADEKGMHPWARRDLRNKTVMEKLREDIATRIGVFSRDGELSSAYGPAFTLRYKQTIGQAQVDGRRATIFRVWTISHEKDEMVFCCTPSRNLVYLHEEIDGSDDGEVLEGDAPAGIKRWKHPDCVDLDLSFWSCVRNLPKEKGLCDRIVRKIECSIFYLLSSRSFQAMSNRFAANQCPCA